MSPLVAAVVLVSCLVLAACAGLGAVSVRQYYVNLRDRAVEVPAQVVHTYPAGNGQDASFAIEFTTLEGLRVAAGLYGYGGDPQLYVGSTLRIHYNPDNPGLGPVDARVPLDSWSETIFMIVLSVFLAAIGIVTWCFNVAGRRRLATMEAERRTAKAASSLRRRTKPTPFRPTGKAGRIRRSS